MQRRLTLHLLVLLTVVLCATTAHADAFTADDTLAAIDQAASTTGVTASWLARVVGCETGGTFDPYAVGDHGTSLGPAQLHVGGGELSRFYAQGYGDPFDPYQAVSFMASEFALGRAGAWSCR